MCFYVYNCLHNAIFFLLIVGEMDQNPTTENLQISSETNKKKLGRKKQYKCNTCQFEFSRKALLNKHKKSVHEGIKPYKCSNCEYEAADKWHLNQHKRAVHERIKPHKCNNCDYETVEKGNLKIHTYKISS